MGDTPYSGGENQTPFTLTLSAEEMAQLAKIDDAVFTTAQWLFLSLFTIADYYTVPQIDSIILSHTHDGRYYTEGEIDSMFAEHAALSHTHDDRYYTEDEIDSLLSDKSDTTHNHDLVYAALSHNHNSAYAALSHTHDNRYYTESEITTLLSGKSDSTHNHDSDYADISHTHDEDDLSLSDVTTGDVNTNRHGFCPKLPGGQELNLFLRMDGSWAVPPSATGTVTNGDSHDHIGGDGAPITEEALSLSDVTTMNVNTSRHGLVPKATGSLGYMLRADGAWANEFSGAVMRFRNNNAIDIDDGLSGAINGLQVYQSSGGDDALMTFHVAGDYAGHFGLDGGLNDLVWGGYSVGATTKRRIWHSGNLPYGRYKNLKGAYASATTVSFTWTTLAIEDIISSSGSLTANITSSGANGRDTGSEAVSTWYYIWAIATASGTVALLLSASSTSPTMPSGYTRKRLISCVYNNSSGNFTAFKQYNEFWMYDTPVNFCWFSDGDFDLSSMIPTTITNEFLCYLASFCAATAIGKVWAHRLYGYINGTAEANRYQFVVAGGNVQVSTSGFYKHGLAIGWVVTNQRRVYIGEEGEVTSSSSAVATVVGFKLLLTEDQF